MLVEVCPRDARPIGVRWQGAGGGVFGRGSQGYRFARLLRAATTWPGCWSSLAHWVDGVADEGRRGSSDGPCVAGECRGVSGRVARALPIGGDQGAAGAV